MIVAIVGARGRGKTLACTYIIKKYISQNVNVISNFHTSYSTYCTTEEIINNFENYKDVCIAIDEAQLFFDSRNWKNNKNKDIGYFLATTRKKNIDLILTCQYFSTLELRIRQQVDIIGYPSLNFNKDLGKLQWFDLSLIEEGKTGKLFTDIFLTTEFMKSYDTNEIPQ